MIVRGVVWGAWQWTGGSFILGRPLSEALWLPRSSSSATSRGEKSSSWCGDGLAPLVAIEGDDLAGVDAEVVTAVLREG